MLDYKKIGQQIRILRRERNISQEQLSEKVDISPTHMSHIETGTTKLSLPVFVDIANALNVSADALLEGNVPPGGASTEAEIISMLASSTTAQSAVILTVINSLKAALDENMRGI